jgi:hypothetical protein
MTRAWLECVNLREVVVDDGAQRLDSLVFDVVGFCLGGEAGSGCCMARTKAWCRGQLRAAVVDERGGHTSV